MKNIEVRVFFLEGKKVLKVIAILFKSIRQAKRIIIGAIGFTILAIGLVMIVLPGPAIIVIPVGLGILATEFVWARRLLKRVREKLYKKQNNF